MRVALWILPETCVYHQIQIQRALQEKKKVHAAETIKGILFITLLFLCHSVLQIIWCQHM